MFSKKKFGTFAFRVTSIPKRERILLDAWISSSIIDSISLKLSLIEGNDSVYIKKGSIFAYMQLALNGKINSNTTGSNSEKGQLIYYEQLKNIQIASFSIFVFN